MRSPNRNNKPLRGVQLAAAFVLCAVTPGHAQDVRGLEVCTAEKQMERRTSCLQANTEFLQGVIDRNARDARQKLDAAAKDLSAARNEIGSLKAALAATQARLDKLEKATNDKAKAK
jgi:septal ring factor EnvC (AmiA/AmiB activator)